MSDPRTVYVLLYNDGFYDHLDAVFDTEAAADRYRAHRGDYGQGLRIVRKTVHTFDEATSVKDELT